MSWNRNLEAFSLLETVVAMLLIMLSIGLSATLFVGVGKADKQKSTKLIVQLQQLSKETIEKEAFFDEETSYDSYTVVKEVSKYEEMDKVYYIKLTAIEVETNQIIASWNELTSIP